MKFEKYFLISISFVLFTLFAAPSFAADKLASLEAFWNSAEVEQLAAKKNIAKKTPQQINAERQALSASREKLKRDALQKQRAQQIARNAHAKKIAEANRAAQVKKIAQAKNRQAPKTQVQAASNAVSYTHLTLPTICSV